MGISKKIFLNLLGGIQFVVVYEEDFGLIKRQLLKGDWISLYFQAYNLFSSECKVRRSEMRGGWWL